MRLRRYIAFVFFFVAANGFAQYDPSGLSAETLRQITELEAELDSATEAIQVISAFDRTEIRTSKKEDLILLHHPNAQIREFYLWSLRSDFRKHKDTTALFDYVLFYLGDSTNISTREGCVVYDTDFASHCYDWFYNSLTKEQQRIVYRKMLLSDPDLQMQERLIENLAHSDESYAILEELVYRKHKIKALSPLLAYENPKDTIAPVAFLEDRRSDALHIMGWRFSPAYEKYARSFVPEVLSNTWKHPDYTGYFTLLEQCSPETRLELCRKLSDICDDTLYRAADFLFRFDEFVTPVERDAFLLRLLPSVNEPDTATVSYLRTTYPQEFEHALERHLLLSPNPYEEYQYGDSTYARFMLRDYTATPSDHKTDIYRQLIKTSNGPVLVEAVLQLNNSVHRDELIAVLEKRHAELVIQLNTLSPGERYAADLRDEVWMRNVEKAIVYVNDEALNRRLAVIIAGYFAEPGASVFDEYAALIIWNNNDPVLFEQLLRKLENKPYQHSYNRIAKFIADLENPTYNKRLAARLFELERQGDKDVFYFRYALENRGIVEAKEHK